jgi:hypothetical protein
VFAVDPAGTAARVTDLSLFVKHHKPLPYDEIAHQVGFHTDANFKARVDDLGLLKGGFARHLSGQNVDLG